jgi:hypothetical protein
MKSGFLFLYIGGICDSQIGDRLNNNYFSDINFPEG